MTAPDRHLYLGSSRAVPAFLLATATAIACLAAFLPLLYRTMPEMRRDVNRRRPAATATHSMGAVERTLALPASATEASFPVARSPHDGFESACPGDEAYRLAWTDRHPPAAGAFPEWVTLPALIAPSYTPVHVQGRDMFRVNPDAEGRFAGYSGFAATAGDALASAWACVAARIQSNVAPRVAFIFGDRFALIPPQVLREAIRNEIHRRHDALLPAVHQDAIDVAGLGTVHRAAVCAVCPPEVIDAIASSAFHLTSAAVHAAQQAERMTFLRRAAGVGGGILLLLVALAVYAIFNAATKGYYAWRLRIAAAVLYLASLGALLLAMHYLVHTPGGALPGI